jgi:cyclophilin family peptidyl-prolyl cis-trans isomerase
MMKANRRRLSAGFRPRIEVLEDRCVPADFSGSISGTAFVDRNHNGRFDLREKALSGGPVKLTGKTDQNVAVNVTARADAHGKYRFDNVMPGSYKVFGSPTSGRILGPVLRVVIHPGQNVTRDIAFGAILPGAVNLRQLLNNAPPGGIPGSTPGSGVAKAADRPDSKPTISTALPAVTIAKNKATDTFVDMAAFFKDVDTTHTMVRFHTTAGNINVELFDNEAPQTVANFLNYITSNKYDSTVFHRLATGFVLQAGGFTYNEDLRTITEIPDGPPVKNEPGTFTGSDPLVSRSNLQGTLAMAKIPATTPQGVPIPGGGPDSATNQFFFNLGNNATNLDTQNGGFTVFGKIVGTADQTVLNALAAFTPTDKSAFNSAFDTFPLKNYSGTNFPTDVTPSNLAMITDVEVVKRDENLKYSIVSNVLKPGTGTGTASPVTATFVDGTLGTINQLKLNPVHDATGTATITIRATDKFGATVDQTFDVIVANDAPTASVTLSPATTSDSTLTANASTTDANGDPVTLTYEWSVTRAGTTTVVKPATTPSSSTSDTLDLSMVSSPGIDSFVFTNNNEVGVDGILSVAATGTDPDGTPVTFTYEWRYNNVPVKTTPDDDGTDSLDLTSLTTITRHTGDVVTVTVTPKSGTGVGDTSSPLTFTVDRTPTENGIADQVFSNPGINSFDTSDDFDDPDGDTLTFTATLANGNQLPTWLTIVPDGPEAGTLRGDPGPNDEAVLSIKVTATDPVGRSVSTTFQLTVTNDPPTITTLTPTPDTANPVSATALLRADVVAADVNADPITVTYVWTVRGTIQLKSISLSGETTFDTLDLSDPAVTALVPGGFMSGDTVTLNVTTSDGGADPGQTATDAWTIA